MQVKITIKLSLSNVEGIVPEIEKPMKKMKAGMPLD